MARVKRGTTSHARHKKIRELTRGYRMTRHRLVKVGKEAILHAGEYAYAGRKHKKRDFRRLWITRISGALKNFNMSYNRFIAGIKKAKIELDRKILAELIFDDPKAFKALVDKIKNI